MAEISYRPTKVAVVGTGFVGSTTAYSILLSGIASEIVLVDVNKQRAEGEAMDIAHAAPYAPAARVFAGDYSDIAGASVTVIAAGANQKPGETRLDLTKKNAAIFKDIIPQIVQHNPNGILVVATNPVDVLTYAAWKYSGSAVERVIGSGTILDTARFRYLLSQHFGYDASSVHGYILGEHGDTEVPIWSLANVAGMRLPDFCQAHGYSLTDADKERIFESTRKAAYEIINRKGATYYAVAAGITRLLTAILRDQQTMLTVSSLVNDYYGINEVCLSLPTIIGRDGVERVLHVNLSDDEAEKLKHSAATLRQYIESVDDLK